MPEGLRESAGNLVSALWRQAQEAAADNFAQRLAEVAENVESSKRKEESVARRNIDLEAEITSLKAKFEESEQRATEAEKMRLTDITNLAAQERTLKSLYSERDRLTQSVEDSRKLFSQDLEKMNASMRKAEQQYRVLEKKSLLELEKVRQSAVKLEKENLALRNAAKTDQERLRKENASLQNTIAELSEKLGNLTGRLAELSAQHKDTCSRLKVAEKKLAAPIPRTTTSRRRLSGTKG